MITGTATVLTARDIAASLAYYRDALGFEVAFEYGQPTFYVGLCRDEAAVHLIAASKSERLPGNGALCIFVDDVDALHAELVARKARVVKPPQDTTTACAISTWSIWTAIRSFSVWQRRRHRCQDQSSVLHAPRKAGHPVNTGVVVTIKTSRL